MNEANDSRELQLACAVGINVEIVRIITKRIPKEIVITLPDGEKKIKDGDAKAFWVLRRIYNCKAITRTLRRISPNQEIEYLQKRGARETLQYLSYTAIHALYLRYKILEVLGNNLPPEIDIINMFNEEIEVLVKWLFIILDEGSVF